MTVEDNIIHRIVDELAEASSDYRGASQRDRAASTPAARSIKRGIALTPVKFGISFNATHFNQAGALVHVYTDGSVLLNHGGTEMGQGLYTKVAQVVAEELQIDLARVRTSATDTSKVPNTSATAASSGTDLNGKAAQAAARTIKERLIQFAAEKYGVAAEAVRFAAGSVHVGDQTIAFADLVMQAYTARVSLWSSGLLSNAQDPLGPQDAQRPPVLLLRLRRGGVRGGSRHAHRRDPAAARGHPARRRNVAQSGGRPRAGRRRLSAGRRLADERGAVVERRGASSARTRRRPTRSRRRATGRWMRACTCSSDAPNVEDTIFRSKAVGEPPLMLAISVFHAIRDAVRKLRGARCTPRFGRPGDARVDPRSDRIGQRCGGPALAGGSRGAHMSDWLADLTAAGQAAEPLARIAVASVRGSAPREAGACMLVSEATSSGSIGGGRLELTAIESARDSTGGRTRLADAPGSARSAAWTVLRRGRRALARAARRRGLHSARRHPRKVGAHRGSDSRDARGPGRLPAAVPDRGGRRHSRLRQLGGRSVGAA